MYAIDYALHHQLIWRQPDISRVYTELCSDDQVLASLSFDVTGLFKSRCEGKTASGAWTFHRQGVFLSGYVVKEASSAQEVAVYRLSWLGGGGHVTFSGGLTYRWKHQDLLAQESSFILDERKVMTVKMLNRPWQRPYRYEASLELHQAGLPGEEVLILLGWYMKVLEASQQLD
jgi:hypothetical protein